MVDHRVDQALDAARLQLRVERRAGLGRNRQDSTVCCGRPSISRRITTSTKCAALRAPGRGEMNAVAGAQPHASGPIRRARSRCSGSRHRRRRPRDRHRRRRPSPPAAIDRVEGDEIGREPGILHRRGSDPDQRDLAGGEGRGDRLDAQAIQLVPARAQRLMDDVALAQRLAIVQPEHDHADADLLLARQQLVGDLAGQSWKSARTSPESDWVRLTTATSGRSFSASSSPPARRWPESRRSREYDGRRRPSE